MSWTERWTTLSMPGSVWTDKDWYTDHGVPKGATVFVMFWNYNTAYGDGLSMRPNGGSMTNRYCRVDESQGTDNHDYDIMWCETDANGINEWRESGAGAIGGYLYGYLENVSHTCKQDQWFPSATSWTDKTLPATPGNSVAGLQCQNASSGIIYNVGVRANGSSENRQLSLDPYDYYNHGYVSWAQSDSSSIIEHYANNITYCFYKYLGYFSGCVYSEDWNSADPTVDNTWQDLWLGTIVPQTGVLVSFILMNMDTAMHWAGLRENGSSLDRRMAIRDYDHGSRFGTGALCKAGTDPNRIVEVYSSDRYETEFWYSGYFEFGWGHKIMGVTPGKVMGVSSSSIKKIQGVS